MRDKQIEEMTKDIKVAHDEERYLTSDKSIKAISEYLYNAGYRKASDVAREVIDHIDGWFMYCEKYSGNVIKMRLAELKKKCESEEK